LLVKVARLVSVGFIRRRIVNLTLNAHGRTMDEPPALETLRRFDQAARHGHIGPAEFVELIVFGPKSGRDVKHSLERFEVLLNRPLVR
jgi:hypothetical protein